MSDSQTVETNDQLILISGPSGSGKTASLRDIPEVQQPEWLYLNCEAGKRLPFKNRFDAKRIEDPWQVHEAFDWATDNPKVRGIIVDTTTFMMDMFETQYVIRSTNTMQAWGDYAQFFKALMQEKVVRFNKPVIMLAHTLETLDDALGVMSRSVPVKGSLKNQGIEAYFSTVVSTKRLPLKDLKGMDPKLLHILPEDEAVSFKHVFQTRITKATIGERIRAPMGLFSQDQTFIDNNAYMLLEHLRRFYA